MWSGDPVLCGASSLPRPVILTKVRTQSHEARPPETLGPDFRQDDGVFVAAPATIAAAIIATVPATAPTPFFTPFPRTMR
jgi:hypothetical protein